MDNSYKKIKTENIIDSIKIKNSIKEDANPEVIYKHLEKEFGYKYLADLVNLSEKDIKLEDEFSLNILEKLNILALKSDEKNINIAISDPSNYELIDTIEVLTTKNVNFFLAKEEDIKVKLKKLSQSNYLIEDNIEEEVGVEELDLDFEIKKGEEFNIIPLVNHIILKAYKDGSSDIHLEPKDKNFEVRFRIDGILITEMVLPKQVQREVISRIKIVCDMNVAEKRLPQDGRFSSQKLNAKGLKSPFDVRVSTFPTVYGEKVVMRILNQDALKPSLEDLNLPINMLETLKDKIFSPYGLILVTGPTGSGKTTTLYSALSSVDKKSKNVLTVEDPVEYRLDGVHQMQVNDKIGLTFASGLKTILRQDPDIVMVGEIRDLDTANMAVRASLTGHIVFSTLHTNDSTGVVLRLMNMGIEPFLVAASLSVAIAQRLVRTICPNCAKKISKEEVKKNLLEQGVTNSKLKSLGIDLDKLNMNHFDYGDGCYQCKETGYKGRRAIFELFEVNEEIREIILRDKFNESEMRKKAIDNGMTTLAKNALDLVKEGVTTIEEVVRVIGEK